ncbi:uncharacterized protein LOC127788800 [Diospyros lotus]|uniref:uncharacterized protein LOC127788800 n=1 Tax=Diospyros lotus TaxID=55363 RepID=UPI00224EF026|nr:uncharacterized protein LOC127788800 [Diospyros lotus]
MNRPQDPPEFAVNSATQLLRRTSSIFYWHLLTFVFLAFLLLGFRYYVETGSNFLAASVDRDPSFRLLLSRLNITTGVQPPRHRRRRPLITRIGVPDGDFFGRDDGPKAPPNASFLILGNSGPRLGFSNSVSDNGIRFLEIVRWRLSFQFEESTFGSVELSTEETDMTDEFKKVNSSPELGEDNETERSVIWEFLVKGLEPQQHNASDVFFVVFLICVAYGHVVLCFVITYTLILGIVFVAVVNRILGRHYPQARIMRDGLSLGFRRLSGFILIRWFVRDVVTQILSILFLGEIGDQYSFFKIFVRLKSMPFLIMSPFIWELEKDTASFLLVWIFLEIIVEFIFAVGSWVAIVDHRRDLLETVREGCYLLLTMFQQAVVIQCFEVMLCGPFTRWILVQYVGKYFTTAFQSVMEVYFMVAWLIFYFAVRSTDATNLGGTFGRRELEEFIQR